MQLERRPQVSHGEGCWATFVPCMDALSHTLDRNTRQGFKLVTTVMQNLSKCANFRTGAPTHNDKVLFTVCPVINCLIWTEMIHFHIAL